MNNIAKVLKVIGVLKIIAEVIIGLVLGLNFNGLKFYGVKWGIVIQQSVVGFISGMLIIGFAEIIELLHKIAIKLGVKHPTPFETNLIKEEHIQTANKKEVQDLIFRRQKRGLGEEDKLVELN